MLFSQIVLGVAFIGDVPCSVGVPGSVIDSFSVGHLQHEINFKNFYSYANKWLPRKKSGQFALFAMFCR